MTRLLSLLGTLTALASTFTHALPFSSRALPIDPSQDPFYQPPAGYDSQHPGTILRTRSVDISFFGLLVDPVEAWQLLYRTTAINGTPIATVTTVFKPLIAKTDRFISYQTAYDSTGPQCSPSYSYQLGSAGAAQSLIADIEFLIIQAYLASGYIVASSDYEGPDVAFTAGHLEGMVVLDGIRAVSNFGKTLSLSTSTPAVVGVGYSGGGIATSWAAALQSLYAPEVNVKGWVAGGVPANLTSVVELLDNTLFSGFLSASIAGLSKPSAYGAQLNPLFDRILTPHGRQVLDQASQNCAVADLFNFFDQSIESTDVQTDGAQLLYDPDLRSVLRDSTLGVNSSETPTVPMFIYHASQDEAIPYNNSVKLVDTWCAAGVDIKFTTFGNGGHVTTDVVAVPDALEYVANAFAGSTQQGCTHNTDLATVLDPIALGVELEPILTRLLDVLVNAGEGDENIKNDLSVLNKTVSTTTATSAR